MTKPLTNWKYGDDVLVKLPWMGELVDAIITAVDLPTRRLRVILESGHEEWVYTDWCRPMCSTSK
jgi:hypothetical protein